ncbi:hypothetical protein J3R30DRAFT_3551103 [Lentinula aciculospora]|uniref:Serine/threonine-protein kinase Tel1 n=1 Tax=Lentinula aciculospora TaxID=153920 RepID=A0A9W8ZYN8_9AGAR|nr:hypothetical protein J3R30DRAFT_3551103 [Lentinula aciculospora]
MSDSKIHHAVNLLQSTKVKERQEGIDVFRNAFALDSSINRFFDAANPDGRRSAHEIWAPVLSSLQTCIRSEKSAYVSAKKSTVLIEKRLANAAGTYRWFIEKVVIKLTKKTVFEVCDFLYREMKVRGALIPSVALDFIKAYECVVSHAPHLARLEDEMKWQEIVELAFNVVLGRPLRTLLAEDESAADPPSPSHTDNSEMFVEDSLAYDEDEDIDATSGRKRRHALQSSPTNPKRRSTVVSPEQVSCMSLLSVLFKSSSAPLLQSNTARPVLRCLATFLDTYPTDTSLHHDFLAVTLSTLRHVSLNHKDDVIRFAIDSWDHLLNLWGTKNKTLKEALVTILRMLFPFLTADPHIGESQTKAWTENLTRLWSLMNGQSDKRWTLDPLSLCALRLEISARDDCQKAFRAKTFRAGIPLDSGQALTWAMLELQGDCAEKLFQHFELTPAPLTQTLPTQSSKRSRLLENPLSTLLRTIQSSQPTSIRVYNLQILLFFIDRHWNTVHESMQSDIIRTLLDHITNDDGTVQSWAFVCLAAVAYADCNTATSVLSSQALSPAPPTLSQTDSMTNVLPRGASTWDSVWTHAIRRTSSPQVCRAACHAASILLVYANTNSSLTHHRVLSEIEILAKDLDVQGPTAPYDSVCLFLSQCLKVANQDVRLYRMQLEEKVLTWLIDSWKPAHIDTLEAPLYLVSDVLTLLETICSSSQRSSLICRVILPQCLIVETVVAEEQTRVIRDYLLDAKLPSTETDGGRSESLTSLDKSSDLGNATFMAPIPSETDLVQPRSRERRISTFFLKCLESAMSPWQEVSGSTSIPRADAAKRALDIAVVSLSFESVLVLNGILSNRRVIQAACKLIASVTKFLDQSQWTMEEKGLVLLALEPLFCIDVEIYDDPPWTVLLPPSGGTGIRSQTLKTLLADDGQRQRALRIGRMKHLKTLWRNLDVQATFSDISEVLKDVLRIIMGRPSEMPDDTMAVDDGFGIAGHSRMQSLGAIGGTAAQFLALQHVAGICLLFLSVGPLLQQSQGEPTRDKELTKLMLEVAESDIERFLLASPAYFDSIRNQTLNLSPNHLGQFIDVFAVHLRRYETIKHEKFHIQLISFLDATMSLCLSLTAANQNTADNFLELLEYYSVNLLHGKLKHWRIRDSFARLCDRYLILDPSRRVWVDQGAEDTSSAMHILPILIEDIDIRVRFRAVVINARVFQISEDPMALYETIRQKYTTHLDRFELMLTRILSLGNIMVVSSAVRRGPYWHLLETCFYTSKYNRHIETILTGVSQRMGLNKLSDLFEAYAYQLAFSILQAGHNVLQFPVNILGYKDRKERANETIRAFTPANLVIVGNSTSKELGRRLFEGHCQAIQRPTEHVINECFGDIVGYQVLAFLDGKHRSTEQIETKILATLASRDQLEFRATLKENVDSVAASIMGTLSEQDFTGNGTIIQALRAVDGGTESTVLFSLLTRYRQPEDIDTHITNLPNFSTHTILNALSWLTTEIPGGDSHALTYHVLQALFANVQRSFLINEQIRLVNAISLWIAYRHQRTSFHDATLLHALIRGACSLLGQWDLVPAAQSILEWCFSLYDSGSDPRFPDILIRVACLCHDYAIDAEGSSRERCQALLQWVDNQTFALSCLPNVVEQVKSALPAWPHEPSEILGPLFDAIDPARLSEVLTDKHISSNKFRLVRRLRDQSQLHVYDPSQFAQTDFWKLKECMPPSHQLREEDVHAFASLLVLNQGSINGFGSEPEQKIPPAPQSRSRQQKEETRIKFYTPESSLILVLLKMLDNHDDDGSRHAAYRTLRSLMLTLSLESFEALSQLWPSEYRIEVCYLREFRQVAARRQTPDLSSSLSAAEFIEMAQDFSTWISAFATLLADILSASNPFYAQLCGILASHTSFTTTVLPLLVQTLLESPDGESHSLTLSRYLEQLLSSENTAVSCRRSIIDIVLHLRHIKRESRDALAYNRWLQVSFLSLARNAITCGAYTTGLLFLELHAEYREPSSDVDVSTEQIMYEIYGNIDEPDGFYAIRTQDYHQFLIRRFHHEKEWEKAFRFHGAALETDTQDTTEIEGLLQSLHSYGFNHIATQTLLNSNQDNPNIAYQLGWRAETWDLPESNDGYHPGASLYLALRAVHRERDQGVTDAVIRHVLLKEMENLRTLGSENIAQIREAIQSLMSLSQAIQWRSSYIQDLITEKCTNVSKWSTFTAVESGFHFDDTESIMATRISLIKSARRKEQRHQIGTMLSPFSRTLLEVEKQCLVRLSQAARETDQIQIALNSVIRAKNLEGVSSFAVTEEFASVLWAHKEEKHAVEYLKDLRREMGNSDPTWQAQVLARLGAWTADACLEQPSFINHDYFGKAITLIDQDADDSEGRASVYHQVAKFAEAQYKAVLDSPDLIRLNVYKERKEKELRHYEQLKQEQKGRIVDKGLANTIAAVKKVLAQDNKATSDFINNRDAYLKQAIQMYSWCLEASDKFDEDVPIRFCSLWLSNFDYEPIQKNLGEALKRVPSRKLVFLAHQIFSRIGDKESLAQKTLRLTMIRMCSEHPFHSLYQLFCLQPPKNQAKLDRRSSGRVPGGRAAESEIPTGRSLAAKAIFKQLLHNPATRVRTAAVEELCDASLTFANFPVNQSKEKKVPDDQPIRHLRLSRGTVPVITAYTPIDPTSRYDPKECVCVDNYAGEFDTAGGINLPKIIFCNGTDGRKYKQLFKGDQKDDLRQDAVMEQVFDLVNVVLNRDVETKRRNLYIRGYKVIPLASQAGILEFVGNTTTLKSWLDKAHIRYRPNDMRNIVKKLAEQQKSPGSTPEANHQVYLQCMQKFKPVMRHYFTEIHKTPIAWFRTRLNYTRSVATTSIVGYILGLGDRHTSNILMDNSKGEVIHIDLGVAFDQGKLLPVPENVPFRMTPDMVDGMGISGTNGVFQRCAEETLRVLRDGSDVIMTVLQVFRYDPLYNWTMSDYKMKKQVEVEDSATTTTMIMKNPENERILTERLGIGINLDSTRAQEDADRALMGVSGKLSRNLSVAAAVRTLVAEATDTYNLGTIFYGWGPYY